MFFYAPLKVTTLDFDFFFNIFFIDNTIIVNVPQNGVTVRIDVVDSTIYDIIGCGDETVLSFDATGNQGLGIPPAINWQIQINLPDFENSCYVHVLGVSGTNGLVNTTVPVPPDNGTYSVLIQKGNEVDGMGYLMIAGLTVRISYTDHLFLATQSSSKIIIEGTPADAELVIIGTPGTQVEITSYRKNIFLVDTIQVITSGNLKENSSIITFGNSSISTIETSWTRQTFYNYSCLTFDPRLPIVANASTWFINQISIFGVPASALQCAVYTSKTNTLMLDASVVIASGLGRDQSVYNLFLTSGDLVLYDSNPWNSITIFGSLLEVDDNYRITLSDDTQADIYPVLTSATHFTVTCGQPSLYVDWYFGGSRNSTRSLQWEAIGCSGFISSLITQPPSIFYTGYGDLNCQLSTQSHNQTAVRNITLDTNSVIVNDSLLSVYNISWDYQVLVDTTVYISDGSNEVYIIGPSILAPTILLNGSSVTNITAVASELAIIFQDDLTADPKTATFTPTGKKLPSPICFQPIYQCTPESWVDMESIGKELCVSAEEQRQCLLNRGLTLQTNLSFHCLSQGSQRGWSLQVNPKEQVDTHFGFYGWATPVISTMYFVTTAYGAALRAFLPIHPNTGWYSYVITAFLIKANDQSWNLQLRSFVQSTHRGVANLLGGWSCGIDGVGTSSDVATIFIICTGVVIGVIELFLLKCSTSRNFKLEVTGVSFAVFITLPVVVYRVTTDPTSIAALVVFVGLVLHLEWLITSKQSFYARGKYLKVSRINGGILILNILLLSTVAVLSRPDIPIDTDIFLGVVVAAVSIIQLTLIITALWHRVYEIIPSEKRKSIITKSSSRRYVFPLFRIVIEVISWICGIVFIVLLRFKPSLPSSVFLSLWFIWVLLPFASMLTTCPRWFEIFRAREDQPMDGSSQVYPKPPRELPQVVSDKSGKEEVRIARF